MMRYVGVDVSAKTLSVHFLEDSTLSEYKEFDNTSSGHKSLIKYILSGKRRQINQGESPVRVCLEATGMYHFDCAVALSGTKGISIMVVNPRAIKAFAGACMKRNKSDKIDSELLALFCERMDFVVWSRPSDDCLTVRSYARKLSSFAEMKTQLKNQLHAMQSSEYTSKDVTRAQNKVIQAVEAQIEKLKTAAIKFVTTHPEINELYQLILSIKGFGELSTIQVLGELLVMPKDMTAKQWVSHSGLNPVQHSSGTSVKKKKGISKVGNRYLRRALYMPAMSAANTDSYVRGYYWHLINDNGLKKRQSLCAIMRKMLHMIHKMLELKTTYDASRFYHTPLDKSQVTDPNVFDLDSTSE